MPQYVMPIGSNEDARRFSDLDAFTRGYIEAMLFTENGHDGIPEDAGFGDLDEASLATIVADCLRFQRVNADLLGEAYSRDYTEEQAGRDFWFTRNGHGVGYWDREALAEGGLGDRLSAGCPYSESNLYVGEDKRLHII